MRFAQAGVSVDKQRIVRRAGVLRNGVGRIMRKAVGVADDEAVKCVARQLGRGVIVRLVRLILAKRVTG